jgi:transposase
MGNPKGVQRDFTALEQRRMKAAKLFNKGCSRAEVARQLGVSYESANRWHRAWQNSGASGLKKAGRAGRKPRLQPFQLLELQAALQRGPETLGYVTKLWTLPRVAELIGKQLGIKYHPAHVSRILRQLGWSCQKPARRALERDEEKIRHWKRSRWPAIKKKPAAKGESSSSSTKAD